MNTRLVNAAAGVIGAAMSNGTRTAAGLAVALESACLLQSPETAAELERLREKIAEYGRPVDEDPIRFELTAKAIPAGTVYRASHKSIVLRLYTTADEARKHCESMLRREWPTTHLDWIEDEEDGVAELVAETSDGETPTGYVVTALEVASEYDEGADE
ncbi:hypothetical protein [Streptomyces sp. PD-S100-1]|uniref:hypothetical protein n=1 Tax=Streptomyces sp. PD-S100-1 TaxID=3394351 RepID=UPI0039BC89CD